MRLALDHHYSPQIAAELRARKHDVVAAQERGWLGDEELLSLCCEEGRALMSNNVRDFIEVAKRWMAEGRRHFGLIFTSDASMPRARKTIGRYVSALEDLLRAFPAEDALADRVAWL